MFVPSVEEKVDRVADHARDLSEYTLMLISRDIDLIKKGLDTSSCTFLNHELHKHCLSIYRLRHSLLFNYTYLFSEDGLKELHQS